MINMEALHILLNREVVDQKLGSKVMMEFNKLTTDQERVTYALELMHRLKIVPKIPVISKSNVLSEKYRAQGNHDFLAEPSTKSQYIKILELYTKSIAYAEPGSKELLLAYGNRSATLLQIAEYEECIKDVDRALAFESSPNFKVRLYARKIECLLGLGQSNIDNTYNIALNILESMKTDDPEREKFASKLKRLHERSKNGIQKKPKVPKVIMDIPIITSRNSEVPCASDRVSIEYDEKYGRHVVATRNISPGEVIAVENPYAYSLIPDNFYSHCANCLEVCWTTIPCDYCYISMYCSEKCRSEFWEKCHEMECTVFSIVYEMSDFRNLNYMSLRLTMQAVKEAGDIFDLRNQLQEVDESTDPRTKGFDSNKQFHSDKYTSIYSLQKNTEKRSSFDVFRRAVDSAMLLYFLVNCSKFFGKKFDLELDELAEHDDATFVGGLLLSNEQIVSTNAHSMEELYEFDNHERSTLVLAFCSLFNHSCDPNVIRISMGKKTVVRAIYPIMEGEQLFDNYTAHYAMMVKSRRQEELLKQYNFFCACTPCEENWLTHIELPSYEEFIKIPQQKALIKKALSKLDDHMAFVASAKKHQIQEREDIIKDLLKMIDILYKRALLPCKELNTVVETVKFIYNSLGNTFYVSDI